MSNDERRPVFRLEVGAKGVERDLDTEIEFHIAMRTRKLIAAGMKPANAHAQALHQFGDLSSVRDQCLTIDHERERAMKRFDYASNLRQDVLYGLRSLSKHKSFTAALLLILALARALQGADSVDQPAKTEGVPTPKATRPFRA